MTIKRTRHLLLLTASLASLGAGLAFQGCGRRPATAAAPTPTPTTTSGYRDPMSVSDPAEQQRIRDENSKKFLQWDYKPSEGKSWTP